VLRPLSQGRDDDRKDVQTVIEVGAEALLAHGALEVAVRGRDQPYIHLQRLRPADALELAILQHTQELGLQLERKIADLDEEERASVGELETADLPRERAGERPLLVPEELAFDHTGRESGAVDLHEELVLPLAHIVDRANDELLPGTRLARNQHCGIGLRHLTDAREDSED